MAIGKVVASGGVRQASFEKSTSWVLSFLSPVGHTLVEYPLGKPLDAKLLKKLIEETVVRLCLMREEGKQHNFTKAAPNES